MSTFLWKFYWDCGRMGSVEGLFVATDEEVNIAIGEEVYFGEILGKHSEVSGVLEESNLEKLDIDSESVMKVAEYLGTNWSGYNPLNYIHYSCDECKCSYSAEEMWTIDSNRKVCAYCRPMESKNY